MSFLAIGSIAIDHLETPFEKRENVLGGAATFISIAASYFVDKPMLVGAVGEDFGEENLNVLKEKNIDLSGLQIVKGGKTFRWHGRYHYDMNNRDTIETQLNVLSEFNPVLPNKFKEARYVCLGNLDPVIQRNVLRQVKSPKLTVCDTMNYWIENKLDDLKETLKLVDALIINDSEARLLSQSPNLVKAARLIRAMGPKILVIKKGEHGALLFTDGSVFAAPAYPLETIVDPTGAGDAFAGGFTAYLAKVGDLSERSLRKAVLYGSAMASFCVEKFGTEGLLNLSLLEIDDRYRSFLELSRIDEE
ncbi:MAG: PfkB family carbohydrate kinase [Chloroherpetonaceae bacterium]|nr:PfkB family carbohydrate kinase [Chloroherpetonaceae bacterium]MDW8438033.1 PfkB family carbohydrate kinase [Chloroherpetonaceae bacterium]